MESSQLPGQESFLAEPSRTYPVPPSERLKSEVPEPKPVVEVRPELSALEFSQSIIPIVHNIRDANMDKGLATISERSRSREVKTDQRAQDYARSQNYAEPQAAVPRLNRRIQSNLSLAKLRWHDLHEQMGNKAIEYVKQHLLKIEPSYAAVDHPVIAELERWADYSLEVQEWKLFELVRGFYTGQAGRTHLRRLDAYLEKAKTS